MTSATTRGVRIVVLALALAVAALAVATPAAVASEPAVSAPQAVPPVTLVVAGVLSSGVRVRTSYSLRQLRDLRITGHWNVPGTHVQRVEVRAPDGSLYQRLKKRFTTNTAPHVAGDGRALGTPVLMILPVGGTWITEYSLVGDWRVDLFLDNGRTPLASYTFTLTP